MLLAISLAFAGDFLESSDDFAKSPCVIHLVQPEGCASDARCVQVINRSSTMAIAPSLVGYCKSGQFEIADTSGTMQVILDPKRSRPGHPVVVPVLAPKGSGFPSQGWMYLPNTVVDMAAVAYTGVWTELYPLEVAPSMWVNVFDDDPTLDVGDHIRVGTCRTQTGITMGRNKTIEFSSSCSAPQLAKSNRR